MSIQSKMNLLLKPNLRALGLTLSKYLHLNAYFDFCCYIRLIWKASFQLQCEGLVESMQGKQGERKGKAGFSAKFYTSVVLLFSPNISVNYSNNYSNKTLLFQCIWSRNLDLKIIMNVMFWIIMFSSVTPENCDLFWCFHSEFT